MDAKARNCLLQHREALEKDIKTSYIMDHMISDGVLTVSEEEKVKNQPTKHQRAAMLIKLILKKDNYSYISFYNALLHEGYKDLAALLHSGIPEISSSSGKDSDGGITSYVRTVLCEGGVPQRPVVFVTRKKLVNAIQQKLFKLNGDPGWVTIYGMAGCGKSVLAAEAVRDHSLLEGCFPGGVHWVSVGKQDKSGLLMKLQNLCSRLDQDESFSQRLPLNIEEAKDRLRILMLRKHPRSLLILDDIWDSWVLKAFDNQCQILLTTRDKSVTDSVMGPKYVVSVESGLGKEKGLEILSLFVNMKKADLPEQAHSIIKECKGSPLVVSLIGALLRDFPNRWEYYLRQLQNKQFKRIRKSSSYDYEALDEAMSISVEMLREDIKDYYTDLSILQKDVKVPTKDLHKKMITQFQRYYQLHTLSPDQEDCMYWYNFLAYHMASANMHKELCALMFSLDWIKAKTELVGPAHLIHEFVEYRHILDEKDCAVCENFQEFLSLNGHLLGRQPFPNIVQLGLCEPETSEVYQQAKLRAKQEVDNGMLYLEWINKKTIKNLSRLVVRPHTDAVYHACFSEDGQRIASCGADKTLQVFKAETGEKLLEIKAHEDEVLCCAFSTDDKFIATCSVDKKVKIWNSVTGELVHTYDEHAEQVNCCHFTNKSHPPLLATGSSDFFLKLWDLNQKECRNTMFGHTNSVNHCRFSPDDELLASCSADGTLKLFDIYTSGLLAEIHTGHHSTIQYCDFSPQNHLALVALSQYCVEVWETKKVCKSSAIVLKQDVDVVFQENEVMVLAVDNIKHLLLINGKTGQVDYLTEAQVSCCCLSPHLQYVAFGDEDGAIQILELLNNRVFQSRIGHKKAVRHIQFTADGKTLISSSDDSSIQVWNIITGRMEKDFVCHQGTVLSCDVSSDATKFSSTSADKTAKIWNFELPSPLHELKGHNGCVRCSAFSVDSSLLATGDDNGEIRIWNVSNGELLHSCAPISVEEGAATHGGWVTDLYFSPHSKMLVSAGGHLKWWNVETGESLQTFYTNGTNLKKIHVSPDFKTYVTVDNLGILYILQILE
ncbi:Apoptotic protease-activating factor 1 [Sciurus carolinensis]|uniref:Apoptotic protease-activating factor 1 n=1 Tax=Sciurus carolinensis TaxID=30640 RepID=A0AA41NIY8_SCICA|nr:Apoptotic protease-activating factor 1 [Sciurus carolinensis]